jgi:cofilin
VIAEFNEIKLGRVKAKFVIYVIQDGTIVTEKVGTEGSFEAFVDMLPPDDCRYAIYDMDFSTQDGRPGNKLVSISWAPDTAKIKSKMVYAGSKDALTRALVGVSTKVAATDRSELTEAIVVEACRKFA